MISLVLLVVLFSSIFANIDFVNAQTLESYKLYQNTVYGFSIQYPQDWNLVERMGPQYSIKTVLVSPNANLQINAGVIKNTNPYAGLTSQEILGHITGIMRGGCSQTTIQNRGFTCSNPQFQTNMTSYRGVTIYDVMMIWKKTYSSGQTVTWISAWGMLPYGKDTWVLIMEGSSTEFIKYGKDVPVIANSFDIQNISQSSATNIQNENTSKQKITPIPSWIKNTAKWWSEGSLTDDDFIKGIQYLVQNKIILIHSSTSISGSNVIPAFVKNTAKWWSEGSLTDDDFIKSIQYLVEKGIISTSVKPKTLDTMTKSINIRGGTMSLPSGSNVLIPPNLFSSSQSVTLSLLSSLPQQPPSGVLVGTGPALELSFGDQQISYQNLDDLMPQASALESGKLQFSMKLSNTPLSNREAFSQIADVIDSQGNHNFQGIEATYDKSSNTETFAIESSQVQNAKGVIVSSVDPSPSYQNSQPTTYGPKMWDGNSFNPITQTSDGNLYQMPTGKRTLVLVHGILSNVNDAFNQKTADGTNCIEAIKEAGGYDQVVGFDYDYTDPITKNGLALAKFLDQLKSTGAQVDVEAHSLGTIVSLYAAQKTQSTINNMVLLGGPIDGTPITKYGLTTFLANTASIGVLQNTDLARASQSNVLHDLQPGSALLQNIKKYAINNLGSTNFIRVVGEKTSWYTKFFGPLAGIPNDGIIPVSSARGEGLPGPVLTYPDLAHTDLECNKEVIDNVGTVTQQNSLTISGGQGIQTGTQTGTQTGSQQGSGITQGQSVRGCGGYRTCEDYCQYEIGSEYHYDASTNTCRITASPNVSGGGSSSGTSGSSTGGASSGPGTISAARDLTGNWGGSFTLVDNNFGTTTFHSSFSMTLSQSGNSISGTVTYDPATSVEQLDNGNPKGAFSGRSVDIQGTVSSSSFTATTSDGTIRISGSFTTDLIRGTFTECSDGYCSNGSFQGNRR